MKPSTENNMDPIKVKRPKPDARNASAVCDIQGMRTETGRFSFRRIRTQERKAPRECSQVTAGPAAT
ncbi:hypothetical protein DPEC_G00270410 [Dallia pectoralis]|uniref:Uncharacterized protein n=1 Tax=Dallia pectoralis TaxID=75939 RepID=A0ACC2FPI6_DALPE|nr:hypothetical protein DPEC_G00270410 [Dallia pectoralis]